MPTSPVARLAVALAGFALVVPIPAAAQEATPAERLRVGSETIDPSGLTEGTRRYRLILVQGEQQQEIGTAATEVSFVQVGDRATVRKVQIIQSDMIGGQADTAHAARDDLAALRVRSASANGTLSLDFDEARVTGRVAATGAEPRSIEQTLEERPFAVQTLDLIVRSLPLEEGAAWDVPVYTADSGELTSTRLTVVGSETVESETGEPVEAWVVTTDAGGRELTWWVSKAGRQTIRSRLALAPGVEIRIEPAGP